MPDNMMSIADIVRETGMDRSALNRYLAIEANREFLGGKSTHPVYPARSLATFHRLSEQHAKGQITPKTLAASWTDRENVVTVPASDRNSDTAYPDTAQELTINPLSLQQGADAFAQAIIDACQRAGLVIGQDRLLCAEEAAQILNCKPRGLSRRVPPVERGSWRLSDVQRYIASLQPMSGIRKSVTA